MARSPSSEQPWRPPPPPPPRPPPPPSQDVEAQQIGRSSRSLQTAAQPHAVRVRWEEQAQGSAGTGETSEAVPTIVGMQADMRSDGEEDATGEKSPEDRRHFIWKTNDSPARTWQNKVIRNLRQPWRRPQQMPSWDSVRTVELQDDTHGPSATEPSQDSHWLSRWWWEAQGWVLASVLGFCCFFTYVIIELGIGALSSMRFGFCINEPLRPEPHCPQLKWVSWLSWGPLGFLMSVAFGTGYAALSAHLMQFAPAAAGSGIPEVKTILNGFVLPDVLTFRTLIIKIPGLILAVASGMALGHEGPMVHVAVCWGQLLTRLFPQFKNECKRREVFSAAMAAGVSVAFGAPVGGVLFSLEESSSFPSRTLLRAFLASVVATLSLSVINITGTEKGITMFSVKWTATPHPSEYIMFMLLGLAGGLVGAAFNVINIKWNKFRKLRKYKESIGPVREVTSIAFLTLCTSWWLPLTRYLNPETIHALFDTCASVSGNQLFRRAKLQEEIGLCSDGEPVAASASFLTQLGFAAFVRFWQTSLTIGMSCPAGLFVPSLYIGACLGRCMGGTLKTMNTVHQIFAHNIDPGVYSMVGAAAVLAGVTRMTISLVVIMLELTDSLDYVVPFMLAVLVARTIGNALTEPIYDLQILMKGYPYLHEELGFSYSERCSDVMETGLVNIDVSLGLRLGDLRVLLRGFSFRGFSIVDGPRFLGYVRRAQLEKLLLTAERSRQEDDPVGFDELSPLIDTLVLRMVPDAPVSQAHQVFKQLGRSHIFIVGPSAEGQGGGNDHLLGVISKKSFLKFLQDGRLERAEGDNLPQESEEGHIGPFKFTYARPLWANTAEHIHGSVLEAALQMSPRSIAVVDQAERATRHAMEDAANLPRTSLAADTSPTRVTAGPLQEGASYCS